MFMYAIHGHDSCGNHSRIPDQIGSDFFNFGCYFHAIRICVFPGYSLRGCGANVKLRSFFNQSLHFARLHRFGCGTVHINRWGFPGFKISEMSLFGKCLPYFDHMESLQANEVALWLATIMRARSRSFRLYACSPRNYCWQIAAPNRRLPPMKKRTRCNGCR
jgi:hypothetical protein